MIPFVVEVRSGPYVWMGSRLLTSGLVREMTRRNTSATQLVEDFREKYPEPLGHFLHHLWQQIAYIHLEWGTLGRVFGTREQVELLNHIAPRTFRVFQECLHRSVLLGIARLTDPQASGRGRENATLQRLPGVVREAGNSALAEQLELGVRELVQAVRPIRENRNRLLAHADLALALGSSDPLLPVTTKIIDEVLTQIRSLIQKVEHHYQETSTFFEVIELSSDTDDLLDALEAARRLEAEERARALGVGQAEKTR